MSTNRRMKVVEGVFAAAIADDGTLTVAYPAGTNQAYFSGGNASAAHQLVLNDNDVFEATDADTFSVTFGGGNITLTNLSGASWPAGTRYKLGLAYAESNYGYSGQVSAAIAALTDGSTGTASDSIASISDTPTKNAVASLAAKLNSVLAALKAAGITK